MSTAASMQLLNALRDGRCATPFDSLGLHPDPDGKGQLLRAWWPGADWVEVVDLSARRNLGRMERLGDTGFFYKR